MSYQSILNPHPVTGPLTDVQLRAAPVPVSGTVTTGGLTDAQLRASAVPVSPTALVAGAALIGKVGIDQTVPGTTNKVSIGTDGTVAINAALPTGTNVLGALSANQSVNAAQVSGTAIATGNGTVSAGVQRVAIASDNTAFSVNAMLQAGGNVIGALTANQSVNVAQMNGVAVTMGSGVTGTGVQRVVLATDVALPTGANVLGALTANQSVNLAQVAGVATATGNGVVGTGVQRVAIASDNSAISVTSAAADANATFRGRAMSFRTPGRAGTTGQKIFALHNATGSTKLVHINQVIVDLYQTVIKAVTVAPPVIRVHRFTAVPTNGSSVAKVGKDSALSSNASITAWGDASADGTGSGTALTVTIPASSLLTQEYAPRLITAVGYEMFDRTELLVNQDILLRALEGIVVFIDYTLATQNPTTDIWIAGCDWWEV